jgi:hypothetical protein
MHMPLHACMHTSRCTNPITKWLLLLVGPSQGLNWKTLWSTVGRFCHFLDHILCHNLPVMFIIVHAHMKIVVSATPARPWCHGMLFARGIPFCWVCHQACPTGAKRAIAPNQHNGLELDHYSIVVKVCIHTWC